jgi:hypothetical protein
MPVLTTAPSESGAPEFRSGAKASTFATRARRCTRCDRGRGARVNVRYRTRSTHRAGFRGRTSGRDSEKRRATP